MRNFIVVAIFLVAIFSNYLTGILLPDDPPQALAVTAALTILAAMGLACAQDALQKALHDLARMEA